MPVKKISMLLVVLGAALVLVFGVVGAQPELTPIEELGEFLYFDENLSDPAGQSCASCHTPEFGFVDPDKGQPVSEGVIPGLFGGRNSPASAYAMYAPIRYFDEVEGLWIGGQFWDSRATGDFLGDPLADQAIGPFENPVEMANTRLGVLTAISESQYSALFEQECGVIDLSDPEAVDASYHCVGTAIASFERTPLFGQFSSKYDYYLQQCISEGGDMAECAVGAGDVAAAVGPAIFSKKEWYGLQLFMGEKNNNDGVLDPGEGAMCVLCHVAEWTEAADYAPAVVVPDWAPAGWVPPLFTDFTYDNLGVPKSDHKLLKDNPVDLGLGPVVGDSEENGKFKVMTLRNIAQTAPYAHNGFFKKLEDITHFYNTRDAEDWPAPEVPETINTEELGNLGLSSEDEAALVKFMKTLSDGWTP